MAVLETDAVFEPLDVKEVLPLGVREADGEPLPVALPVLDELGVADPEDDAESDSLRLGDGEGELERLLEAELVGVREALLLLLSDGEADSVAEPLPLREADEDSEEEPEAV